MIDESQAVGGVNPLRPVRREIPTILRHAAGIRTCQNTPFGKAVLGAEPVAVETWIGLAAVTILLFWIVAAQKWLWRMRMSTDH